MPPLCARQGSEATEGAPSSQMRGFGSSYNSHFYGITCADEAKAYLADPVLGGRLRAIAQAFLNTPLSPFEVFGRIDTLKVRSCMTLFDFISPNDLFGQVLDAKYDGARGSIRWRYCRIPITSLLSPERDCSIRTPDTENC